MARTVKRLTDRAIKRQLKKGLYADGDGLCLQVSAGGSKSWIFRFKRNGRARDMGLGGLSAVGLATARKMAKRAREDLAEGRDPIEARDQRTREALAKEDALTFKQCAEQLISSHEAGWRNAKHRQQWRNTLTTYAYPLIGQKPVTAIDTDLVLKVLRQPVKREGKSGPLWNTKTETASRLRGRMEAVLSWAKAKGLRAGENPATWRGHLDHLLPARSKVRRVVHHPALDYREIPAFMRSLADRDGVASRALEFVILTASRTGEVLGACWPEIDLEEGLWTVPPERMKAGRAHRVPLSTRTIALLKQQAMCRADDFIFPGMRLGRPLSDMSLLMLLRDMGFGHITVHGFRSSFRDWAAETTNFPREVAEAALAHVVADKVEAAYLRSDLFEKRRKLMNAWVTHCIAKRPVNVLSATRELTV
jgi:integrase